MWKRHGYSFGIRSLTWMIKLDHAVCSLINLLQVHIGSGSYLPAKWSLREWTTTLSSTTCKLVCCRNSMVDLLLLVAVSDGTEILVTWRIMLAYAYVTKAKLAPATAYRSFG